MCNYFSCLFLPNGEIRWCEDDSHETTIYRLGLDDVLTGNRRVFLRVESSSNEDGFRLDSSNDDLPSWYAEHVNEYADKLKSLKAKIDPIHHSLVKAHNAFVQAQDKVEETYDQRVYVMQERNRKRVINGKLSDMLLDYVNAEERLRYRHDIAAKELKLAIRYENRKNRLMARLAKLPGYAAPK